MAIRVSSIGSAVAAATPLSVKFTSVANMPP
jgi:hypothetical protein